jgi:hypothetical protein
MEINKQKWYLTQSSTTVPILGNTIQMWLMNNHPMNVIVNSNHNFECISGWLMSCDILLYLLTIELNWMQLTMYMKLR